MDYTRIKEMAKGTGRKVTDLMVLAPQNDPFYVGTGGQRELAEWFAGIWKRFECTPGYHIRRVHYRAISQEQPILLPNGTPYENTVNCKAAMENASKYARYLGLVDPADFVDKRNGEPIDNVCQRDGEPEIGVSAPAGELEYTFPPFPELPGYELYGFEGEQRYHVELWAEKSTMDDILQPLCERYKAVYVYGVGELSITHAFLAMSRLKKYRRPLRIYYVSDFDPAGLSMPVAVARKIEKFLYDCGGGFDVRLFPLVLTREQCRKYKLPRTPIKETERRRECFEERFGEGATELDALEALHPGELARIVEAAMGRYFDADLDDRVSDAVDSIYGRLGEIQAGIRSPYQEEIDKLRKDHEELKAAFDKKAASLRTRTRKLWQAIRTDLEAETPAIDASDIPEAAEAEEIAGPLFDSGRNYMEQLSAYKKFQGK